ncbi:TPA: glycosyltransferase family 4 protein [Clostridium perfringens]|uniref:glycosyltransferase family 4 protein n=4 Tax=Clostridium perfringens TaxID=1502 RepID=UPI001A25E160|nr:glycosyltransferase family 4 protein [Clostridium perfringens]EGT3607053.1 glycosyltransferase family 4 protein [Clostridium perfringens]MDU5251132.1 glycosyltransferase family 4 protein [Clostridium perfringens]MDZ5005637.1 glycosyltransferase [Clostridium perfringens]HAT4185661.1 glycosyltransferase family 4 protein [Clostridium perfringens]HAT4189285.1 glycosyltransferase family 4 protein [Clostridium perfringens]
MKILVVTDKLYPDEIGGSCTYAYETIINMCENDDIDIFTCYPEKSSNNKYFPKCNIFREFKKNNLIKSSKFLKKIIEENKYERIIFHSALSFYIYKIIKRNLKWKAKEVVVYHGPWHKEAKLKFKSTKNYKKMILLPLMKKIQYYIGESNDVKFVFLSNYMRNELININRKVENINYKIIPGGVSSLKFDCHITKEEAREKLGLDNDEFIIFSLRRLEYRMGLQNIIDILDDIKVQNKKVRFIIGGKGPYEEFLKGKAKLLQKNKCDFKGFIKDNELNLYFKAADLFVVPSIDLEGFGLVILESLAMGLPVLATPQGGMVEMKEKLDGYFLSNKIDSYSLLEKINEIGNTILKDTINIDVSNYSWENISKELLEFVKE